MTDAEKALLWAKRSDVPVPHQQRVAEAYLVGIAASSERIKELEARVAELEKLTDDGSLSYAGYRYGVVTKLSDHERRIKALERLTEATTIRRPYGD